MQAAKGRRATGTAENWSLHDLLAREGGSRKISSSKRKPMLNHKRISAGLSLVVLALGFSLLGILSFLNGPQGELAMPSALEKNFVVVGSAVSVLAGAIFLFAACRYWKDDHRVRTEFSRSDMETSRMLGKWDQPRK